MRERGRGGREGEGGREGMRGREREREGESVSKYATPMYSIGKI